MTRGGALAVSLALACCWAHVALAAGPSARPFPKVELAGRLLELHLRARELRGLGSAPGKHRRGQDAQRIERHVAFLAEVLRTSGDDATGLRAARAGSDLAAMGVELIRADFEPDPRGLRRLVRHDAYDAGMDSLLEGMSALEKDPAWATTEHVERVMRLPRVAREQALAGAPASNAFQAEVLDANIGDSAAATAVLLGSLPGSLGRVAVWMRELRVERAVLDWARGRVDTTRGALVLVSEKGTLILRDAEVIALAQEGKLARPALSLYLMSRGGSGKVPEVEGLQRWVEAADKRPVPTNTPALQYQVRQCGPTEVRIGAETWADGVRLRDSHVLVARYVGDASSNPFEKPELKFTQEQLQQFERYAAIVKDPRTPIVALEVVTNDAKAVPFFRRLMEQLQIPGQVVIRP